MRQIDKTYRPPLIRWVAAATLAGVLGVSAAACGTSGSARTHNAPAQNAPAQSGATPTTAAPSSGGAGF